MTVLGIPYRNTIKPVNWREEPVSSSISQISTRNCIPWATDWEKDAIQYQRKPTTRHGPRIRAQ